MPDENRTTKSSNAIKSPANAAGVVGAATDSAVAAEPAPYLPGPREVLDLLQKLPRPTKRRVGDRLWLVAFGADPGPHADAIEEMCGEYVPRAAEPAFEGWLVRLRSHQRSLREPLALCAQVEMQAPGALQRLEALELEDLPEWMHASVISLRQRHLSPLGMPESPSKALH